MPDGPFVARVLSPEELAERDRRLAVARARKDVQTARREVGQIAEIQGQEEDLTAEPTPVDAEPEPAERNPAPWEVAKNRERQVISDVTGDYLAWLNSPEGAQFRATALWVFRLNAPGSLLSDEQVILKIAQEEARRSTERVFRGYGLERPVVIGNP